MTFSAFEQSAEAGRPIELYRFVLGSQTFEYTTTEDEITVGAITYAPEPIKRGAVAQGQEARSLMLELEVPATNLFAVLYAGIVPGTPATVTISSVHRGDFPSPEVTTIFQGEVTSVAFVEGGNVAKIAVRPALSATSRPIPRRGYQSLCDHVLYDSYTVGAQTFGCKVNKELFRQDGAVTAISGATITVPGLSAYPSQRFRGGFVEAAGGLDFRMILDHTGDVLTLLLPFPFSVLGQVVSCFQGCDHTVTVCDAIFNNIENYGGSWAVPAKNIFETGL